MPKRYYEVEFGVWVQEPDPLGKPSCGAVWNGVWDHGHGTRPRCFRPEGHEGDHHETRNVVEDGGLMEYFWTDDPMEARSELRPVRREEQSEPLED